MVFGALVFKLSVWCGAEVYVSGLRAALYRQLENQSTKYHRQQPPVIIRAPDDGHNGALNVLRKQ